MNEVKEAYKKGYIDGSLSVTEQILEHKEKEIRAKVLETINEYKAATNSEHVFIVDENYINSLEEQIRADERANTVQFIVDEFNRRTVCLGRATAKMYVIDTLNEILNELKEQK